MNLRFSLQRFVNAAEPIHGEKVLSWKQQLIYAFGAVAAFHLAYTWSLLSVLLGVYLFCLFSLARARSARQAFYIGLALGMCLFGPQLLFFYTIFKGAAVVLWLILAFWIGLYLAALQMCWTRFGRIGLALCAPFLWTGLEYFRSELYYLRFSWLNIGFVFSDAPQLPAVMCLGVYGVGFVCMAGVALISLLPKKAGLLLGIGLLVIFGLLIQLPRQASPSITMGPGTLSVAGIQAEFPSDLEIPQMLDGLIKQHPSANLLVMSEYSLEGLPTKRIINWCRQKQRYLAIGGKEYIGQGRFYNTVFVIDPKGDIVFRQVKKVPIQFFKDGLPATEQKLWNSPWGLIGFCVCYDLSYSRVVDQLIRLGAQAVIVPTMDVADWGIHQHQLHARVAPVRAAEYGIPLFRLASSGISQCVDERGVLIASAPFPGDGMMLGGTVPLSRSGSLPLDRWIAPLSVGITGLLFLWFVIASRISRKSGSKSGT